MEQQQQEQQQQQQQEPRRCEQHPDKECRWKSWPELKGKTFEEAEEAILKYDPCLNVGRVKVGIMLPQYVRCDRVLVRVDDCGIVAYAPHIG